METNTTAKIRLTPFVIAVFSLGVLSAGLLLLTTLSGSEFFSLAVSYACEIFSLFIGLFGIAAAFAALSCKKVGRAVLSLFFASLAQGVALICAAILTAYSQSVGDVDSYLASCLGSAFLNVAIFFFLHAGIVFLLWFIEFLWQKAGKAPWRANIANLFAVFVLFCYRLYELLSDTLAFLETYAPNYRTEEIVNIVFDFVFLFGSFALGWFWMNVIREAMTK